MTTPQTKIRALIESEFDKFFEFPGTDKSQVTSVSCKLFAEHIAALSRPAVAQPASVIGVITQYVTDHCVDGESHAKVIAAMNDRYGAQPAAVGAVPHDFPPYIMGLLREVADRSPGPYKGPWEDQDGMPRQDDADAAIAWIEARAVGAVPEWQPIEAAPIEELQGDFVWLLVDGSPLLGYYIEIPFQEHRDIGGRYIDQQDADAYWANRSDGEPVHPTHWHRLNPPASPQPKEPT